MKNPTDLYQLIFSNFEIKPGIKASVVIPVKDEEYYIEKVLQSLSHQVDLDGNLLDVNFFEILILANNCTDHSADLIKNFQLNHPHIHLFLEEIILKPEHANIGFVRKTLMDCAHERLTKNGGGIILTTDGDTVVAEDWIAQNMAEIAAGADAVGGRILIDCDELENLDEGTRLFHEKDEKYHLLISQLEGHIVKPTFDPVPRHHQHFNGSFAITTDCYSRSGGVPVVKNLEDCAFFEKLEKTDAKIRHSFDVKVFTSARCIGRTEIGLSYQLNLWKNLEFTTDHYFVESGAAVYERLTIKQKLRQLWESRDHPDFNLTENLQNIFPETDFFYPEIMNLHYFGDWYAQILIWRSSHTTMITPQVSSIDQAITDLQTIADTYACQDLVQTSIL